MQHRPEPHEHDAGIGKLFPFASRQRCAHDNHSQPLPSFAFPDGLLKRAWSQNGGEFIVAQVVMRIAHSPREHGGFEALGIRRGLLAGGFPKSAAVFDDLVGDPLGDAGVA